jgi:hypothetical protein
MSDTRSAFGFDQKEQRSEGIPDLVRQLTEQGSHLAQQQMNLVQGEIRSGVNDVKAAAGAMAGAAVMGLAGLGVTLMGLAYLLAEAMELWLATLIVGVVALGIAYAMFAAGRKKMQSSSLSVDRTRHTLERAPGAISGTSERMQNHGR